MKNIKVEENLIGKDFWPSIGLVKVDGEKLAEELPPGLSDEEKEKVIQSWGRVAVLEVSPDAPFKAGFIVGDHSQFLKEDVKTQDGKFGMRISPEKVTFLAFASDLKSNISLKLIDTVDENDETYSDLPLY